MTVHYYNVMSKINIGKIITTNVGSFDNFEQWAKTNNTNTSFIEEISEEDFNFYRS